jgi:hypothetical protein
MIYPMISRRLTFFAIAAFWLTMNVLLWRAEYGSHSGEISGAGWNWSGGKS